MSEKAVPEPWDAVVMPTDCVGCCLRRWGWKNQRQIGRLRWDRGGVGVRGVFCGDV